jgi:hypothetical protein
MAATGSLFLLAVVCALACAGCKDTRISTYHAPKETAAAPAVAAENPGAGRAHWQAPADWQEQPAGSVRQGSFLVKGPDGAEADMSVTAFPGDVGGDLANINRWRGQLQLGPVTDADLDGSLQKLAAPAGEFSFVEMVSEHPILPGGHKARMFGAIFKQPGRTWFFKMMGPDALVAGQKENFNAFLRSVEFPSDAPARPMNTNDLPGANAMPPMTNAMPDAISAPGPATPTSGGDLVWTAPAGWQPKPGSAMRKGSFAVRGDDGAEADLSIIAFPGAAGGDLANLNRWRGQVGLDPITADAVPRETTTLESNGLHFIVVDFAGRSANGPTRLVGALAAAGGQTWFFKLMGPDALVAHTQPAFLDFLKTVRTP